jgi:hypothetical protein
VSSDEKSSESTVHDREQSVAEQDGSSTECLSILKLSKSTSLLPDPVPIPPLVLATVIVDEYSAAAEPTQATILVGEYDKETVIASVAWKPLIFVAARSVSVPPDL